MIGFCFFFRSQNQHSIGLLASVLVQVAGSVLQTTVVAFCLNHSLVLSERNESLTRCSGLSLTRCSVNYPWWKCCCPRYRYSQCRRIWKMAHQVSLYYDTVWTIILRTVWWTITFQLWVCVCVRAHLFEGGISIGWSSDGTVAGLLLAIVHNDARLWLVEDCGSIIEYVPAAAAACGRGDSGIGWSH